jgi:hypothetical protein
MLGGVGKGRAGVIASWLSKDWRPRGFEPLTAVKGRFPGGREVLRTLLASLINSEHRRQRAALLVNSRQAPGTGWHH